MGESPSFICELLNMWIIQSPQGICIFFLDRTIHTDITRDDKKWESIFFLRLSGRPGRKNGRKTHFFAWFKTPNMHFYFHFFSIKYFPDILKNCQNWKNLGKFLREFTKITRDIFERHLKFSDYILRKKKLLILTFKKKGGGGEAPTG